jgi:hypothetical protein
MSESNGTWFACMAANNLLLRAVNDKVHIPMAPRAAAEQGRYTQI